jgi:pimeloyl-ACP methyl ester carboxylesterase
VNERQRANDRHSAGTSAHLSLAERQAALVAALVADGPIPPGFDPARLAATRRALLRKRAAAAAREWPLLAASFGPAWPSVFTAHREGREPVGALRDGWDVARALRERGDLATTAAAELTARESRMRYDGRSAPRRRSLTERATTALQRRMRGGRS